MSLIKLSGGIIVNSQYIKKVYQEVDKRNGYYMVTDKDEVIPIGEADYQKLLRFHSNQVPDMIVLPLEDKYID